MKKNQEEYLKRKLVIAQLNKNYLMMLKLKIKITLLKIKLNFLRRKIK